jgi:Ca2+-binding RTX toxin-like protein
MTTQFRINTSTTGDQFTTQAEDLGSLNIFRPGLTRAIATDQNGNFVVVWTSEAGNDNLRDVFLQRFDAAGNPIGVETRINTTTLNDQHYATVAMSKTTGKFVVTWMSQGQDDGSSGIYSQLYNADGTKLGGEFRVNSTTTNEQVNPSVAMNANGDFVVTWTSFQQDGSGSGVYAQTYSATGSPTGSEFRVNTSTLGNQENSVVAMDTNGSFIVAWVSNDGSGSGVFAQRYAVNATTGQLQPQGSEFRINEYTTNNQFEPSIAVDNTGKFIVTWTSIGQQGSGGEIYGRIYGTDGVAKTPEFKINSNTQNEQRYSTVSTDAGGNFVVTWGSFQSNNWEIYGQQFNAAGLRRGTAFRVNAATTTDQAGIQRFSSVAMKPNGEFVTIWTSETPIEPNGDGSGFGVFGKQFAAFVNVPPQVQGTIPNQTIAEDNISTFTFSNTLFTDANRDPLTFAISVNGVAVPNTPNSWISLNPATRTFTFNPDDPQVGQSTITLTATDTSGGSASTSFLLTVTPVNDAPEAKAINITGLEDTAITIDAPANVTDVDSPPPFTIAIAATPTNGTVQVAADGKIIYTPKPDFFGTDTFTYTASDGEAVSTPATVTVTVENVNDPPTTKADAVTTAVGTPITIDVLANDFDKDDVADVSTIDPATLTVSANPVNGSVTIVNGKALYTPNAGFLGSDSFQYTVKDKQGAISAPATVTVKVSDRPIAAADTATVAEDSTVTINILANDTDQDSEINPASVAIASPTQNGALTINPDGTVTYTPEANFFGTDSFTYTVKDNNGITSLPGTVTITVTPVNDVPVANPDTAVTTAGIPVIIPVLANDTDVDGSLAPDSIVVVTPPNNGQFTINPVDGTITYIPNLSFSGTDTFTYTVSDNAGGISQPATVTITVNALIPIGGLIAGSTEPVANSLFNKTAEVQINDIRGSRRPDVLIGGEGSDRLTGGAGTDTLVGGQGADFFVLNSTQRSDRDIIRGFKPTEDVIQISQSGFALQSQLGDLSPEQFAFGNQAGDEGDRFIYKPNTGALFYDADGLGDIAKVRIATLSNQAALNHTHIEIIA